MKKNLEVYLDISLVYWIVFYIVMAVTLIALPLNLVFGLIPNPSTLYNILVISLVSGLVVFFIYFTFKRNNLLKNIVFTTDYGNFVGNAFVKKPVAVKVSPKIKGLIHLDKFLKELYNNRILLINIEEKLTNAGFQLSKKVFFPMIIITIQSKEETFMNIGGKKFTVLSLFDKKNVKVAWVNTRITLSLLEHEIAHLLVTRTDPNMSIEKQHKLFRKAGIL